MISQTARTIGLSLILRTGAMALPQSLDIMPAPASVAIAAGKLAVADSFSVAVRGPTDSRLRAGFQRMVQGWSRRTGFSFRKTGGSPALVISCERSSPAIPLLGEDESYDLVIAPGGARLKSNTVVGALRGLATLTQLLQRGSDAGWFLPAVAIHDQPRFPWRGLLIDVGRHWQPIDIIERNLDGMALVKLNVLHLHLTEDQGFRIESRTHPELQNQGSDGLFYTQAQIREIIARAAERGIRVVPEFDLPGHSTTWMVSHPELASMPGPYQIGRNWGIYDAVLDPTNEAVYALLEDFLGEMSRLFPDPYIHIGGDENNHKQWNANPRIQAFIREHRLGDDDGLQTYFNRRVAAILARHGKRMIGWDEILNPDLPKDAVIQSWRGPKGEVQAAQRGFEVILSHGYYIDLMQRAAEHYAVDPLPANSPLTAEQAKLILGGEGTMWGERVTPETIDSRIWPRSAAIAERLWSPRDVVDVDDMYRRMATVSKWLDDYGMMHLRYREAIIRRLAGKAASPEDLAHLRTFIAALEPGKGLGRPHAKAFLQSTPMQGVADAMIADSASARAFSSAVQAFLAGRGRNETTSDKYRLRVELEGWSKAACAVAGPLAARNADLQACAAAAQALAEACQVGLDAITALDSGQTLSEAQLKTASATLDRAAKAREAGYSLPMVPALRQLVAAAARQV
jgi:hexosaminidase